jgi:hypothetical protein
VFTPSEIARLPVDLRRLFWTVVLKEGLTEDG